MKAVEDVVACVVDYGSFLSLAETLANTYRQTFYYSPFEREFQDIRNCVIGAGLAHVERLDEILDPDILETIDLFIFPDIGYGGLQRHLRSLGKAVWGNFGASDLELHRTLFLDTLKEVGLPMVHSERIQGVTALADYLKDKEDKWIKINRFRANMETWHHLNYTHSRRMFDSLAQIFGGAKEMVTFVVQDQIESDGEVGYDGWSVDGMFPGLSFQGYEKKNELYLGSVLNSAELPEAIKVVNEAMAPVLKSYGYRNWWATEIRTVEDTPYFIDPTARMPGQTGEHQLETCMNLPEVIWMGAQGILIEPLFQWRFAAEATLHYDANTTDALCGDEWKTLDLPEGMERWVKFYHYCLIDGYYHFPPHNTDEVGVVIGVGDSVEESIEHLKENLEELKELPLHANTAGFADLLADIKEAEEQGNKFGGEIPAPETILKEIGG